MYAIVVTGGKQYKAEIDTILKVEKLDANVGDKVKLSVLMVCDNGAVKVGSDVANAFVEAEVIAQDKAKKINIFKYKAKKNVRKRQGHRQPYTAVKVLGIEA